jgi:KaiC/GvpD/RAD55 family RecA-like ATPase
MSEKSKNLAHCSTGIEGLDQILGGGLPPHSLYSIQGELF